MNALKPTLRIMIKSLLKKETPIDELNLRLKIKSFGNGPIADSVCVCKA